MIVVLAAGAVFLGVNPHWVRIESVEISLAKASGEDVLFQRIQASLRKQMHAYQGKYFWQVPLKSVLSTAYKDRRVKSAAVYREFPSKLRLEIEPHTPVLTFLSSDGRIYPVATDATLLPPLPITESPDLPFLRGEDLKDEPQLREKVIELFGLIPELGPLRKSSVSEIVYSKKDGLKIYISGTHAEIKVGDSDFGPKISRAQRVLAYLDSRNIKGRVIDARFSKKVVVRVRNTP